MSDSSVTRRDFMVKTAQGAALAASGGLLWAYLLRQEAKAQPYALRPPGALAERDFNATCIKCGQCVNACPPHILKLAPSGGDQPIGMPFFQPRTGACIMCPDIPCVKACPTGALAPELKDINKSRMGLAVIDIENCLSWKGLRCEICYRDCPIRGKAIVLETNPRGLSLHAMFRPIVNSDACTGCGICERSCPTDQAAIRILPHKLVQGKIGEHYRLGWTNEGKITQDFKPAEAVPAPVEAPGQNAPGVDYLNQGGL
ncbi:MAG: ferredoxin-type protein NapG [Hydrogenophilales bacterium CG03_land_8_20_14_0_80_62_28]|nr:ferredoxin-type protein NapG [Betaproteobacteria bacterium]OIO76909.1 MAG: ferredoxin-type protein NapG [Hydrogenophilaceae bacterium CG1_02_62_390]PIV22229.1 MAG: ferredoxin-type protein NapG [Hydrogenophilales bacterium CG03_land_8_20_14_0_80_62_28]PIW39711.1 MAG: ferredoxin-type protein NapG [Hydrogenophilales bacterium CG15_BIG_FIL_POST_REV_8_21_14_020_62_31]PIW72041.1 MAG: ferredoxin-type protein NapG [Hydrogenophilales bacterium CG12_big_fil_rev_8_21_14_0_65_61_21]PIX02138.1 MAG: ferr